MQNCIHICNIVMKMSCHMLYSDHGFPFPHSSQAFPKSVSTQLFALFPLYLENRFSIFKFSVVAFSLTSSFLASSWEPWPQRGTEGFREAPPAASALSGTLVTSPSSSVTPEPRVLWNTAGLPWAVVPRTQCFSICVSCS